MNREPKTTEELLSCEERSLFAEKREVLSNGDTVMIPVVAKISVTPISSDSIFIAWDREGLGWRPVIHNYVWYKQRAIL